jgi:hypothetical protein
LEGASSVENLGPAFLWFAGRQTYEEALAAAGLTDHEGPVLPIRIIGVKPDRVRPS